MRWGCLLALVISASFVAAVAVGAGLVSRGGFRFLGWDFYLLELAIIGAPFVVLAVARTRDWLAWLLVATLTGAVWCYYIYGLSRHEGAPILLGPLLLLALIVISGAGLVTAGVRGMIPDWGADEDDGSA